MYLKNIEQELLLKKKILFGQKLIISPFLQI